MKSSRKVLVLIVGLLIAGALLNRSTAQFAQITPAKGTSISVCNVVEVFNNCERAKAFRDQLAQQRETVNAQKEHRAKKLEAIQMELEGLRKGSEEYKKRLEEMWRLGYENEGWEKAQTAIMMKSYQSATQEMYEQIVNIVADVAKERGVELVLFRVREPISAETGQDLAAQISRRQVLYSDEGLDITEIVLARLNQVYRDQDR